MEIWRLPDHRALGSLGTPGGADCRSSDGGALEESEGKWERTCRLRAALPGLSMRSSCGSTTRPDSGRSSSGRSEHPQHEHAFRTAGLEGNRHETSGRMLLPLACSALDDTPEHRAWLDAIVEYVLGAQHAPERSATGSSTKHDQRAIRDRECALIQSNSDSVGTCSTRELRVPRLHEAAAVARDPAVSRAGTARGLPDPHPDPERDAPRLDGAGTGFDSTAGLLGSDGNRLGVWAIETGWTWDGSRLPGHA